MDENRKKLYDQLSANYDMGTFDEFDSDLDNEDNQKVAWEAMGGQDGYGDFSMFQQAIARSPQAEETETTGNTGSAGNTGNTGSAVAPTEAPAAPMMDAQQPAWTTTASAMPSEEDADADISLPDAPNPKTPKDQSAGDREIVNEPDVVNDKEQSGNVALHTEDYSTKSVEELYAGLGLENKEYSDEELQNELRRSAERIGWISDPVVFEQRKAEFNNSLNELQRRMLVQRAAAQVEQMKPPLAHQEVMPGLDATTAQEIADARNKRFDYLLHGESGKQGSPYTRAVSTQSGWVRSNQLIEQARHKDKSELDEIIDKALNAMSSDPSQRFGSDEEAAIQLAAAMAEEQAQANGGHAKTPSERELEAYYAGPEGIYVEVDGQHDPHEEQLVRQKDAAFRAEVKRHQEGYTHGLRGYATDIEKDPLASADCPVYAIPRMVKGSVENELREKAKERSFQGGQPGLTSMQAVLDDLEANEYDRHLKNAIRIFGPERYEGYVLAWAKKYYTTIANARVAVDNMIRNEIINQLGLKPSNNWEYLFGSVLNNTFVTQGLKALYGLEKGTRPDDFNYITAQQAAYRQYEDEHNNDWQDKLTQMTAPALTLVADAVTGGFFLAGKAAQLTSLLPRLFYASGEAASRSLMNSAIYRIFMANLSGAANLATYEMQSMALQQLATGEYREKHNFWSSLGHAGASGAAKGMVFGTVGEAFGSLFRGVSGKMVYGVEAGKLLAETATFSAMGYLENGNLTPKDAGTNFGLALSGRVSHAGKLIKDIRSRANNEGIYGRKANYHKISEAEKDALVALGYGDVASALRGENISEPMLRRMQNQLEQMRLDKRVSWETIRCCDWVLNGRLNAVPGVRDKIIEADGKGGYTITAVDANGRAIMGSVHVTGTEARNKVLSSINHEIDKASWVENESKMQSSLIGRQLVETVREYAESTGEDAEALLKTYMTALGKDFDHKSLEPVEKKVYETINALRSGKGQPTDIADTKETIGKRFGVDIDQAIKTEKSQRTKEQRAALAEYQEWLDGREDIIDLHQYRGPAIERPYYGPERGRFERKRELGDDEYTTEVEKWRGGVMLGKVVVVNSLDEVTDAKVRKQIEDGDAAGNKSVPGWYDSKTDTAYIYAPHIIDGKDFNETMLHEVVSHKGLRGLLGEADYNKLLDKIWEDMSPSERKALEDYPGGEENESEVERTRRLADEWLAHRAQGVDVDGRNSIWQTAKRHVKDWLRRHGIDVYYSDYELENKLRESYRELAGKGRKTKAERGGEGEPRKEGPIAEGEPEHIHEDKPDDGVVPPDDGGTPPPEGVAAPPAAESGETPPPVAEPPVVESEPKVERPTSAVGRVEGTPADMNDWAELLAENDADSLPVEEVQAGLELMEREREQAHRYANGELAEEPSNWEYWAARDGLSEPTRQAEPVATEPPATDTPKEPVAETESQHTEPVATEAPTETAQRDTKLPKGANAEAETMEPSELPMTEHITKMTDAWGDVTRVEIVGQNDNGTTRVRLWFKNRDQRGVEADVDLRGPQPPETPTPPTEPTGDAATADVTTERPAEVTGSADDRQMRDKLGELLGGDAERIADAQARLNDPNASEFERQAARTVINAYGGGSDDAPGGGGPRFRIREPQKAIEDYERAVNSSGFQVTEALQDSMMGLKKLMQAIVGKDAKGKEKAIQDIAGFENAYLKENRLQSESVAQVDEYRTRYYTPLVKAVSALIGKGGKSHRRESLRELTDYMMAKHGLERNLVLAERDATEEFESDANKDGNGNYIRNYDDILAEKREKDYSGLTALTGETDVAAAEDAARQMVDDYEMNHDTTELWQRTKEATDATLDKLHDSGVLSDEAYSRAKTMFEYYIPLRGWDETTSDEVYGYLTGPDGPLNGNVFKHAEGRSSKADDPLATIMMMASDAIRQGNRNVMKQRFLTFVLNNPSDAVSVSRLWLQRDPVTDKWKPVFADLDPTDSPEVVRQKVEQFEQDMAQLAQQDPDNFKHGKQTENIPYKVVNGNIGEHRVLVKHNGQTYVMTINGNPRAAQALNGLSNPDVKGNNIFAKALEQYKKGVRMMSQLVTTYNPKFVVRNFQRDMAYSITSSALVKEGPEYAGKFVKNYAKVGLMGKLFTKWESGTLDRSDTMENLFYEFMHNGGETGFSAPKELKDYKKALDKELRKENSKTRQLLGSFGEFYLRANRAVENRARFAAFVTSMEMGRGVDRSIWDAKEVSVNFNKKGAGARFKDAPNQTRIGKTAGAVGEIGSNLFMFWNAAVQGLTNYGKTVKANPVGAGIHAATMAALGYVMPQLVQAIFGDDDDYYDLPDYVRRNNICFRWRKDMPWMTIPLTQEHAVMYALGDVAAGLINGKKQYLNGEEVFKDFASEISKALPLDFAEGGGDHWLLPSVAKPYFEAYWMNESWTGAPIANQTEWNKQAPEYQRVYKTASQPFVKASEWVNDLTNSDEDSKGIINFNPSKLEYVFKGYAGGLATLFNDCVRMFDVAFGDAEFEAHDIPVAGAMLKSGNPTTKQKEMMRQYYHYRDDAEGAKWELKNREGDALERFKQTDRYERYLVWTEMSKDVDKLKKQMKDNPDLEAEYYAAVERLVSAMREQHAGKRKPSQETIAEVKESERKDSIEALTDKQVHDAMVPLSDNAPQDSVDVKREGIKRAYKSEGLSYSKPNDDAKNALAYERHATYDDIAEDTALKGRRDALKKSVGEKFEKMGVKYKNGSAGWDWYADDDASASIDEIKAYYQSHKAELDEYGILSWWFGSSKGSSGYIKKGFTDGKHDPDEVMKEYRETRKEVLARTKQR